MKTLIAIILLSCLCGYAKAQKVEISVQANTGFFHYTGQSAVAASTFIEASDHSLNYTNNPYGKHYAESNGAGFKINWNVKNRWSIGLESAFEVSKSRVSITGFSKYMDFRYDYAAYPNYNTPPVAGNTYLTSKYVNLSPYISYRFTLHKIRVDLMPGADIGIGLISFERGSTYVPSLDLTYTSSRQRQKPPTDVRVKLGTSVGYGRLSFNASYAKGLSNYMEGVIGGGPYNVNSELFRLGLGYRVF
jgi:hypothetical protein